jgi:hypothetical protein
MTSHRHIALAANGAAAIAWCAACGLAADHSPISPEQRAVAFLAAEVPKWATENNCYSCHNNGDAARALMGAATAGLVTDRAPLADTLRFLGEPDQWDANGPDGPFKDTKLARIQFGAALATAGAARMLDDRTALEKGAALVAELQSAEGYWETDAPGTIGSPVTYGRRLATAMAIEVLRAADVHAHDGAVAKARRWFERTEANNVLDAAATLLALASEPGDAADERRRQCLEVLRQGRSADGGWGPFVNSPPEAFDTALVVVALVVVGQRGHLNEAERANRADWIDGGRKFLLSAQQPDGGWPPTTRPSGVDSYAQRVSTSGWATQALLATRPGQ